MPTGRQAHAPGAGPGFIGTRRMETDPGPTSRATERRAGVFPFAK